MGRFMTTFLRDEHGATAIEYALVACLIALAILASVTALGTQLSGTYNNIANLVK